MKKLIIFLILLLPITVKAANGSETCGPWELTDGVLTINCVGDAYYLNSGDDRTWRPYAEDITKIVITGKLDVINYKNFQNLPNLEEVVLPESMGGEIADYAFYNCPKLTHIDLPIGFSRIGKYAFYGTGITEVEIPVYVDWIEEHAFPDGTTITRPAEYDDLIAAGTAGSIKNLQDGSPSSIPSEGKVSNNTCYNKYYFGQFYDDTAYWKLYKDGTLVVSGTGLHTGFSNSRNPWGCYKKQIKNVIINDDIEGKITVDDNICDNNQDFKIAVYASKTVNEIMQNRIREIKGHMFFDCREDCYQSSWNVETIRINRGVETIADSFWENQETLKDRDIYINKYVKKMNSTSIFLTDSAKPANTKLHFEVSPEDYLNNNYSYEILYPVDQVPLINNNAFITEINFDNPYSFKGSIVNDIDDTYVSINDTSAPDTIEVDGKTYYKYDTYITNIDGITNISIPNDATVEYVAKEIEAPNGCMVQGRTFLIDSSVKNINLVIETNPEAEIPTTEEPEIDESRQENPLTKDYIVAIVFLSILSIVLILYCTKKEKELS